MKKVVISIVVLVILVFMATTIYAQKYTLSNNAYNIQFSKTGTITSFVSNGKNLEFRNDTEYEGPAIFFSTKKIALSKAKRSETELVFSGETQKIKVSLAYSFEKEAFAIRVTAKNKTNHEISIDTLSLRLGINTEMDVYPHWNSVFFPTMMRCEKDFFWSYLMNPNGEIITVVSPNPVASWSHSYKSENHRIFTTNLDLMHCLPLPERHPKNLHSLKPNEEKSWIIYLQPANDLQNVKPIVNKLCKAVSIDAPQYTINEDESFQIKVLGEAKSINIATPNNKIIKLKPAETIIFTPEDGVGKYKLEAVSADGKTTEAIFSVRKPWSWYMQQARVNAIKDEQKGGSHTESWYGFFSMFLAQKYYPNDELLKQSLDKFNEVYPLMYDEKGNPKSKLLFDSWDIINRIQNTACMASLLAAMYSALHDTTYLVQASAMCDFLIKNQDASGAYRNGKTHYTSVVYIAKSFLEVCGQEKLLAANNNIWQQRYDRHFASAKKAIDELTRSRDNIQTEGEMTYEDGMISCSYTQISMLATLTQDKTKRDKYVEAAEYLRKGHRCLSQLLIPDSRMNGGSLRYWESQYDILSFPNLMSSPHGWSAWRIYGLYYLYQLTGNPDLIEQMYNALGTCVQLVNEKTGVLRWAFCVDPFITGNPNLNNPTKKYVHDEMKSGNLLVEDTTVHIRGNRGIRINKPIGEQYVNMISGWYKAKPDTWVTGYWEPDGGCCDNDVHEIFKCLEETTLTNAFVVEEKDGSLRAYNCKIKTTANSIEVTPNEDVVSNVHFNIKKNLRATIHFSDKDVNADVTGGEMIWVNNPI